eukprot:353627_1
MGTGLGVDKCFLDKRSELLNENAKTKLKKDRSNGCNCFGTSSNKNIKSRKSKRMKKRRNTNREQMQIKSSKLSKPEKRKKSKSTKHKIKLVNECDKQELYEYESKIQEDQYEKKKDRKS